MSARFRALVSDLVTAHLPPLEVRIRRAPIAALVDRLVALEPAPAVFLEHGTSRRLATLVVRMLELLGELEDAQRRLARQFSELERRFVAIPAGEGARLDRRRLLVEHLEETVLDRRRQRADLRALDRHLGLDALRERHATEDARLAVAEELALAFIGRAAEAALAPAEGVEPAGELFLDVRLVEALRARLGTSARWQHRLVLLDGLQRLHRQLGSGSAHATLEALARSNVDAEPPVVQVAALELGLVLAPARGLARIAARLEAPAAHPRDFLVRRLLVDRLGGLIDDAGVLAVLERAVLAGDPSEHVRLGLCDAAARAAGPAALRLITVLAGADPAHPEPSPKVRAAALIAVVRAATRDDAGDEPGLEQALALAQARLADEDHPLPLRVACRELELVCRGLGGVRPAALALAAPALSAALLGLRMRAVSGDVLEAAAACAEALERELGPDRAAWTRHLEQVASSIEPGHARALSLRRVPVGLAPLPDDPRFLGRILADLSRRGFGLLASRRGDTLTLRRGDRFRRRAWRILHELRNPAPSKRQGFQHTVGRVLTGEIRAHAGRLDEETATQVPGERVRIEAEGGWGRHLPLVDDLLDLPVLGGREIAVFSSHGMTTIVPPRSLLRRIANRLRISIDYARLAALRLASLRGVEPSERRRYLATIAERFGIATELTPYAQLGAATPDVPARLATLFPTRATALPSGGPPALPRAMEGFTSLLTVVPLSALDGIRDFADANAHYFLSPAANSQAALAVFLALFVVILFVRHYRERRRIDHARARIPLTIGGWGTRGKSGTERLKAALFEGLGYHVMVKTTGCEAVIIDSVAGQAAAEVLLYRPYDKATIWEQRDVLELAARAGAEVFLWECMALKPGYVEILQHDWMRDDLVTVTNAYPDHEDIQGPSGQEVARVISRFIPTRATLVTSEENFLPLFEETCRARGTRALAVSDADAELIADDLLALFPYREHPRNIALVARLAEELGVDRSLAIATMAEHVVADLGVLKAYPPARVFGRVLTFVNGMSANERTALRSNWTRTGCDRLDAAATPGRLVVTVVNNRDDRVARSEVFAQALVEDLAADRHVLIGTNLPGLTASIDVALDRRLGATCLVSAGDLTEGAAGILAAEQRLARHMAWLRIPPPEVAQAVARLGIYAAGLGLELTVTPELARALEAVLTADGGESLSLGRVGGELRAHDALLTAVSRALSPVTSGELQPPEVLEVATPAELGEHFLEQLARMVVHARLRARLAAAFRTPPSAALRTPPGAALRTPPSATLRTPPGATLRTPPGDLEPLQADFRDACRELFRASLVVVADAAETGDGIIERCARAVPPGTEVVVMGIQNIKGTGLDFAYRWQAYEKVVGLLDRLRQGRGELPAAALAELEAFEDHGLLDSGLAVVVLGSLAVLAPPEQRPALDRALARVEAIHADRRRARGAGPREGVRRPGRRWLDALLDPLDSVRRRRQSEQLLADLADQRISHARASHEMRRLVTRQKARGGG